MIAALVLAADPDLGDRISALLTDCGLGVMVVRNADAARTVATAPQMIVGALDPESAADRAGLRWLARERDGARVIVVSQSSGGHGLRLALERWVDGFVFAEELDTALAPTAAAVLAGQTVVPRQIRTRLRRSTLTFREKQMLALVVLGYTNGQIGGRLFLAESTVKSHLSSAFAKLGVRSRSDAAALVLDPQESRVLGITQIVDGFARDDAPAVAAIGG